MLDSSRQSAGQSLVSLSYVCFTRISSSVKLVLLARRNACSESDYEMGKRGASSRHNIDQHRPEP